MYNCLKYFYSYSEIYNIWALHRYYCKRTNIFGFQKPDSSNIISQFEAIFEKNDFFRRKRKNNTDRNKNINVICKNDKSKNLFPCPNDSHPYRVISKH